MEMRGENEVWLNAEEAHRLGFKAGDYVYLENPDGVREGPVRLKATQRIRKDAVYIVHGFGYKARGMRLAAGRGASDSYLQTRYDLDPISGGGALRNNFVKLSKAPTPERKSIAQVLRERRA